MIYLTAIAVVAFKHRDDKNIRQRIIVFAASLLDGPGADGKVSRNLKNNNVAMR